MALVIDYRFAGNSVTNPDGTMPMTINNGTVVPGPGATALGNLPSAVDLGASGKASIALAGAAVAQNRRTFCIRVVFQANGNIADRQNIVESTGLPFALFLTRGNNAGEITLNATVATRVHGWSGATTRFAVPLRAGVWYTADLAYDADTLGVFLDGQLVSVHAFPNGAIDAFPGNTLFVGSWVDGSRNHFDGKLAALQWHDEVPPEHLSRLDEARSTAEWFCTYKLESIRPRLNLGGQLGPIAFDARSGAYVQRHDAGLIMYHDAVGAAFEMHGSIHALYMSDANLRSALGYLVSDESDATRAGGRKSVFSRGAIYWSPQTGAAAVTGNIYLSYEHLGESAFFGFPLRAAAAISGGLEQEFQGGRFYYRTNATRAFEVHGAILAKFLATGGVRAWGYPITNESDVRRGSTVIGKSSEFENATIYWSAQSGAFEVHGDIRRKYNELGGPSSEIGFPISDEGNIPGAGGPARFNCFQNGSILWFGSYDSIIVARPFKVFVGRVNTKENEGFLMGQNDLYMRVVLREGGAAVYNQRHPGSGDFGGNNSRDLNLTIPRVVVPNSPGKTATLSLDIWDSDPGNDDHLGFYQFELNMANAWGMRDNQGIFNTGGFSRINNISWSVQPQVDFARLTETEKFWGVANRSTPTISYSQYASAFRDVDSETEWWDVTDWLEKAFYELVVKGVANGGNCFGMSLEAIYSRKFMSLFGLPINRFTSWDTVKNEFNVKHCYQVGAEAIWWFVGEFVTGNTHDPVDVFNNTRNAFNRGDHPVICIAQNYDFSGAPHCILPVAWDSSVKPWRMTICDPNFPNQLRTLTVNPDNNSFEYVGGSTYRGSEWSGGRFHYMPFCLLNSRPRTPIWDAILLLLAGTVIILGDGNETASLTDADGNDIDASGTRALAELRNNRRIDSYFVPFKGYSARRPLPRDIDPRIPTPRNPGRPTPIVPIDRIPIERMPANRLPIRPRTPRGKGSIGGEVLMRRLPEATRFVSRFAQIEAAATTHLSLRELIGNNAAGELAARFRTQPVAFNKLLDRAPHYALNDPGLVRELTAEMRRGLTDLARPIVSKTFNHSVSTKAGANFRYGVKHGLGEFRLESAAPQASSHAVDVTDLGTSRNTVNVATSHDRSVTIEFSSKLGVGQDNVRVTLSGVPVEATKKLKLNLRPGLSGLDLITTALSGSAMVTIDAVVDHRPISRRFRMPIAGGLRIKPAQAIADGTLTISNIGGLFGPAGGAQTIRSQ